MALPLPTAAASVLAQARTSDQGGGRTSLAASGAGIERWSALKAPDHGFFIYCEFELNGETKKATWSYDPKRLALSPENDVAINLSSQDRLATQAPRLRPVATAPTSVTESLGETVDLVRAMPTTVAPLNTEPSNPETPALSETADLLDALRKKRNERESVEQLDPHPSTEGLRVVELVPEQSYPDEEPEVIEPQPTPAPISEESSATPKRGRASIPSWDQIVFGTKTED